MDMLRIVICCFCVLQTFCVQVIDLRETSNTNEAILTKEVPAIHTAEIWKQRRVRAKPLFARRGMQERYRIQTVNTSPEQAPAPRICSHLKETCAFQLPCCDPCAVCHCRFFSSICYCWKLSHHCTKKALSTTVHSHAEA